jgi:hypothetical protein
MKVLAIYDSGPDFADRYTVIFGSKHISRDLTYYDAIAIGDTPFHPPGFYQHTESVYPLPRPQFKKIHFGKLPEDCQKIIAKEILELNN